MAKNTTVATVATVAPVQTVPMSPLARAASEEVQDKENDAEVEREAMAAEGVIDVTALKEITVPTFLQRIAAIDEQLALPGLFDLVKDALQKVKAAEIRKEARKLQAEIRVVRAMMPPRTPRVPRAPKVAKA